MGTQAVRWFTLVVLLAGCSASTNEPPSSDVTDTIAFDAGADAPTDTFVRDTVDVAGLSDAEDISDGSDVPADTASPVDVAADTEDATDTLDTATDAGSDDAAAPPEGPFGWIEGPCQALEAHLDSPEPSVWINTYVFDGDPFDASELDADALKIFEAPNAGGSSKCSEVFSMEVMDDCLGADLHATETEVSYLAEGSITDYVITVGEQRIGVSVTRAYRGPFVTEYGVDDALELLTDKLEGVNESSANVAPQDAWTKQILHVWTLHRDWAEIVATAWIEVDPALQADTVVLITVETGSEFVVTDTCDD